MGDVSNGIGTGNWQLECRPVQRGEIEPALRLILASRSGIGGDSQVLDFLSFCIERHIDTNSIWIVLHDDRIVWSMLPVLNPGKTMLIFTPTVLFQQTPDAALAMITQSVCEHYAQRGVELAQMLIDPGDRPIIDAYRGAGMEELAELVYLQRSLKRQSTHAPAFPAGFVTRTYSAQTHADFATVIEQSYNQSLDCPALNGVRDMDDVIAGHQATGDFDPALWWVIYENDRPMAVLLLSRVINGVAMELVYLGISPEARGRGIGDLLMRHALAIAAASGRENLSLAVDAQNQPALRLYYRHGLKRIGSRVAMIRKLKKGVRDQGSGISEQMHSTKHASDVPALTPDP